MKIALIVVAVVIVAVVATIVAVGIYSMLHPGWNPFR